MYKGYNPYKTFGAASMVYRAADMAQSYLKSYSGRKMLNQAIRSQAGRPVRRKYKRRRKRACKPCPRPRVDVKVRKDIKALKRSVKADMGVHIYRHKGTTVLSSSVGQMSIGSLTGVTNSSIEAALAGLRYYDPSTPATLITAAGATGTYQKEFLIKRQYSKYIAVNNYQVPCMLTMYVCVPKVDTSFSPTTAFQNGLADVGNPSNSSPLVYLTDSPQFHDLWRISKSKKAVLQPGESLSISYSYKSYMYDPSLVDSHADTYQAVHGCHTLCTRLEGVLGHDNAAAERGTLQASVDLQEDRVFEIHYSAGAAIKTIAINDISDVTFTNVGVVSNKPVSDNQSYSTS